MRQPRPHRARLAIQSNIRRTRWWVLLATLILLARLAYLQLIEHHRYRHLAQNNRTVVHAIAPKRGLILDRHNQPLATNEAALRLVLDCQTPRSVQRLTLSTYRQSPLGKQFTTEQQDAVLATCRRRGTLIAVVQPHCTRAEAAALSLALPGFPGLIIEPTLWRHYPMSNAGFNVLGYLGHPSNDAPSHLEPLDHLQEPHPWVGRRGLEKAMETTLHGTPGYALITLNAAGNVLHRDNPVRPHAGHNVRLTLDRDAQQAAHQAMRGLQGAVVAVEPATGAIRVLLSNPAPNPEDFQAGRVQHWLSPAMQRLQPLFDRALRGQYPPASTVKPFLALWGLMEGVITPTTRWFDPGWFQFPHSHHRFHDWLRSGHGWVSLHKALLTSCDTYFYHLAVLLGHQGLKKALTRFGFGQPIHTLGLGPQAAGVVASPEHLRAAHQRRWFPGDTVISGIGQGDMLVTPLQLAHATAILANHGIDAPPYLVDAVQNDAGQWATTPHAAHPIPDQPPLPSHAWKAVIHAMQDVIRYGTGYRFGALTYQAAGKTGTAQLASLHEKSDKPWNLPRDDSLFIAFAPVQHPNLAIAVVVEHDPRAPWVARRVMDAYLHTNKKVQHAQS